MRDLVDIRVAAPAELATLVAAFGQERYFRDRLVRQELDHGELLVAWAGATPVGNVYLWRERPFEEPVRDRLGWTPTLNHLEVLPAWQNRGIGTALVRAVEERAARLGYGRICLGVSVENPGARRLYERLGYVDWGHGPVETSWEEPSPDGTLQRHSLTCHWLLRTLPTDAPGVDAWAAWHPAEAYERLKDSTVDWYVAGGWALDLWLGHETRRHADIEVAIDRTEFPSWREQLAGFPLYGAGRGRLRRLAAGDVAPAERQVWARDPAEPVWRIDTFLEERPDGRWVCHWLPAVRHPMTLAVARTDSGIPYLRPELVLLAKARSRRRKDEIDLRTVLPRLDAAARARLCEGLRAAPEPNPWLALLE